MYKSNYLFLYITLKNLREVIEKVASFLAKPITTDQLATLIDYLSFDSMRMNEAILTRKEEDDKHFVRKG